MKRYVEYKDSGIEWIGEIPKEWFISWFKYCFKTNTGISITRAELLDAGIDCIGYGPIHSQYGFDLDLKRDYLKKAPTEYLTQKSSLASENDFIFCDTSEDISGSGNNVYVKNLDGKYLLAGSHTILAHPISTFNSRYVAYLFTTKQWRAQIQRNVFGVKVFSITQKMLRNTLLCLPTLIEQQKIVAYLDRKTAAIDELIADKQKLVALLQEKRTAIISEAVTKGIDKTAKMKDTGIEWIEEIPQGWNKRRLKNLTTTISKGTTPSTVGKEVNDTGKIRFIKAENIVKNQLSSTPEFYIDDETNEILSRSKLISQDILFVIAGATIGKTAIISEEFLPANTNQAVSFIRISSSSSCKYIWYYLQTNYVKNLLSILSVQSAQPNLSMENLGEFALPYPDLLEQQVIAAYLDQKTAQIDALISDINEQIEKLKEYRQAIISEVVTGKVAV